MGKWVKWVMLFVLAMAFSLPAWTFDLKLTSKYEVQTQNYANPFTNDASYTLTYPAIKLNDKILIEGKK
jgi:hypothetical protein